VIIVEDRERRPSRRSMMLRPVRSYVKWFAETQKAPVRRTVRWSSFRGGRAMRIGEVTRKVRAA